MRQVSRRCGVQLSDDNEDELSAMVLCGEDGKPLAFSSLADARDMLGALLDADGTFEVHADGCDGERGIDCDCGVEVHRLSELSPKVQA